MKVVVVGGGLSGYRCICALRAHYPDAELCLVDKAKVPFNKTVMADWLVDSKDAPFALFAEDFFETNSIQFINDIAVRVNFDRSRLFFKNEKSLAYDKLIIATGLGCDDLNFPGANKDGVYSLWGSDPFEMKTSIKLYQNIVVSVSSAMGLLCAQKLIEYYPRNFKILIEDTHILTDEEKDNFIRYAATKDVEIFENTKVLEAIGDTSLKAVKLCIGKFLAANIFIQENQLRPDLSLFKENEDKLDDGRLVLGADLKLADYSNLYFAGNLINPEWENSRAYQLSDELRNASANFVIKSLAAEENLEFDLNPYLEHLKENVSLAELLGLDLDQYALEEEEKVEVIDDDEN